MEPRSCTSVNLETCSRSLFVYPRPRTRSSTTIKHLPEELLLHIFTGVHIRDLLTLQLVCKDFNSVISSSTSLWAQAVFADVWPSTESCLKIFYRASKYGNFEAAIKLALAKMYNHGLPSSVLESYLPQNSGAMSAATEAMQLFRDVELLAHSEIPFTWAFFRPPWAESIMCCKSCIFTLMKEAVDQSAHTQSLSSELLPYAASVAIILGLQGKLDEELKYCQIAARLGCSEAQVEVFRHTYGSVIGKSKLEASAKLEAMRSLRQIANKGNHKAGMLLSSLYARGEFGGIGRLCALGFSQRLFRSAKPILPSRYNAGPDDASRHILIDWMAEVATMKNLDTPTLCNAVAIVDRCVTMRDFQRDRWQLLGVAALVIVSRLSKDPLKSMMTIKEAAWLTDNTYTYEMVVRMVGEIMASLKGHIMLTTAHDYSRIPAGDMEPQDLALVDYILELCLLHVSNSLYSQAQMAVAAILLARILLRKDVIFPRYLEEVTGFLLTDIRQCALGIYEKCFLSPPLYDHRLLQMEAVKLRNSSENSEFNASSTELLSRTEMEVKMGIVDDTLTSAATNTVHRLRLGRAKELICSPSRGDRPRRSSITHDVSRDEAATPPPELDSMQEQDFFADDEMEVDMSLDSSYLSSSNDVSSDAGDDSSEEEGSVNANLLNGAFLQCCYSEKCLAGASKSSCKDDNAKLAVAPSSIQKSLKETPVSHPNPHGPGAAAVVADPPDSEEVFRRGIESPTRTSQRLAAKRLLCAGAVNDIPSQSGNPGLHSLPLGKGTFICHPLYCIQRLQQIHTIFLQVPHHCSAFEHIRLEPTEHYPNGFRIPLKHCHVHALSGKSIETCHVCSQSRATPDNLANLSLKGTPIKSGDHEADTAAVKSVAQRKYFCRPQKEKRSDCLRCAAKRSCSRKGQSNDFPSGKCLRSSLRKHPKEHGHNLYQKSF